MPKPPAHDSPVWKLAAVHTWLVRLSGGRLGGSLGKLRFLLLHHVGARSGEVRITPLLYGADGDDLILVASKGGGERNPAWLHNLRAVPETVVELPGRKQPVPVRAREAEGAERERPWVHMVSLYKPFESYQGSTERRIPIVILEPRLAA